MRREPAIAAIPSQQNGALLWCSQTMDAAVARLGLPIVGPHPGDRRWTGGLARQAAVSALRRLGPSPPLEIAYFTCVDMACE